MQAYQVSFPAMPGFITIAADGEAHAVEMFELWHAARFREKVQSYTLSAAKPDRMVDYASLVKAMTFGHQGVAVWIGQPGWVILDVTMSAPGPMFLEQRPIECFEFMDVDRRTKTHVFAAGSDDAQLLFEAWRSEMFGRRPEEVRFRVVPMADLPAKKKRWRELSLMGITGIGSTAFGTFDILPPWDEAAGFG